MRAVQREQFCGKSSRESGWCCYCCYCWLIRSPAPIAISRLRVLINPNCTRRRGKRKKEKRIDGGAGRTAGTRVERSITGDFTSLVPSSIFAIRERDSILSCNIVCNWSYTTHTYVPRISSIYMVWTLLIQRNTLVSATRCWSPFMFYATIV